MKSDHANNCVLFPQCIAFSIITPRKELRELANNSFKFEEIDTKFSKWFKKKKTRWEKEKLFVTSNFSFFPQCFQKAFTANT